MIDVMDGEGRFNAFSAGSQPKGIVNPFALKVLASYGYPADGYSLQIKGPSKPGYPPTVIVSSPCFPAEHARDGLPAPTIFTQGR